MKLKWLLSTSQKKLAKLERRKDAYFAPKNLSHSLRNIELKILDHRVAEDVEEDAVVVVGGDAAGADEAAVDINYLLFMHTRMY